MKIARFMMTPIKYLLLLLMIVAVFYYRSVIFHTNVTDPIDFMFSLVEHQFDIEIPAYVSKKPVIKKPVKRVVIAEPAVPVELAPSVTDVNKTDVPVIEQPVVDEPVVAALPSAVPVEPTIKQEPAKLVDNTPPPGNDSDADLMVQLSDAVAAMNKKLDKLYENSRNMFSSNTPSEQVATTTDKNTTQIKSPSVANINPVTQKSTSQTNVVMIKDTSDPVEIMHLARQSFWIGNHELSEKYYLNLSEQENADPNVYGELGNVYYSQGKWKQAGEAYYEAALRLLELKQNNRAIYLLRVIQGLDAESAEKLRQKISSQKT